MKNILVTGGNGQLAKGIATEAKRFPELHLDIRGKVELDITDKEIINEVFSDKSYHYCVNCAAFTAVDEAERNPEKANEVNAEAVKHLAEICKANKVVLIHISTDYVFDGKKELGYKPEDQPNPINAYGRSKLQGEIFVSETLVEYFIIRTSWLYDTENSNFYTRVLAKANRGELLKITDHQLGCPTHVSTVAGYILNLIDEESQEFGIHHVTDGESMTWFEFARKILKENQLNPDLVFPVTNYPSIAPRPRVSILLP